MIDKNKEPKVENKFGMNFINMPGIPKDQVWVMGREIRPDESLEGFIKTKSFCIMTVPR